MIVAYVSGHGYGHATRVSEVLRRARELAPDLPIAVVSSAPERLFRRAIAPPLEVRPLECDVGLAQRGALVIDEERTGAEWSAFASRLADRVDAEWRFLRHCGARVVLGDIPPLAFQAAHEAGVPSVGLANFSWDWIYRHYARRQPALREAANRCAEAYRLAGLLLRLPFAGDLSAFPRVEDIPLVARRPKLPKDEARRRLGLGVGPVALVSFGGVGLPGFDPQALAPLKEFQFLVANAEHSAPLNVTSLTWDGLEQRGLDYEDVVGAADVVVTKPGYGIVSDAIGAGTRLVYTDRGDFPEYPILVREMARYLPCVHVSNGDLLAGRLHQALAAVLALPQPQPPDLGGAARAASRVLELAAC